MHIDGLARRAAAGADESGGKSTVFGTITVSDGISMGTLGMRYSLVSREVIADSIETVVGPQGFLADAPTLRDWLLDLLVQIDPAAAALCTAQILARTDSPDEWAVCLRNFAVARSDAEGRAFLEQKLAQLLHNES